MTEEIKVKYVPQGEPGKTCADCKLFTPDESNPGMGACHGHTVLAAGSGYADLRQYVGLHDRLNRDIRRQKVLLRNAAGQLFPELPTCFKDLTGNTALALLRHHAAPTGIQAMSQEAFITSVQADLRGKRLLVSRLRRVHALAATSVGLKDGVQALQLMTRLHIETLET